MDKDTETQRKGRNLPIVTQLINTQTGVCDFCQALNHAINARLLTQMVQAWRG